MASTTLAAFTRCMQGMEYAKHARDAVWYKERGLSCPFSTPKPVINPHKAHKEETMLLIECPHCEDVQRREPRQVGTGFHVQPFTCTKCATMAVVAFHNG